MIKIAFTLIGGSNWVGGLNYQVNLISALLDYEHDRIQPVLFLGKDVSAEILDRFGRIRGLPIVQSETFNQGNVYSRLLKSIVFGIDHSALRVFRQHQVDLVFEAANFYGWRFPIKTIAWITDLQHLKLRHYFSTLSFWKREIGFRFQIVSRRHVMLSSADALKDLKHHYNPDPKLLHVVRFSVPVKLDTFDSQSLLKKYNLPENFFYLPNQFWRHKNHECVIKALAIAKQQGKNITVAVSGNPHDPRDPEHYDNLMNLVDQWGVRDNFKVLGMIPYSDVQALMRSCNTLINPSFFEGWSTTVEEAKALGVRMLLSNLAVHQEQASKRAQYFETDASEDLARLLIENYENPPNHSLTKQQEILHTSEMQMARFASEFAAMLESAIKT